MPYRILVIDDLHTLKTEYIASIAACYRMPEITYARNSQKARDILRENTMDHFDEIYFDHDLGLLDGHEDTAYPIVAMFEEVAFHDHPWTARLFVHTSNSVAGSRMMKALRDYDVTRINADDIFYLEEWAKSSTLDTFNVVCDGNTVHLTPKE